MRIQYAEQHIGCWSVVQISDLGNNTQRKAVKISDFGNGEPFPTVKGKFMRTMQNDKRLPQDISGRY